MSDTHINLILKSIESFLWGWPLIIFVITTGIVMTIAFRGIQFRCFPASWKYLLFPEKDSVFSESYITPFQAFINTLSASIGNGSLAGMATAIAAGGPGAAFWIFILGFFNMAIRFAEVFASTSITETSALGVVRGGPMVYLKRVPGGSVLPYLYAFFCLMLTFVTGNSMQCNSIAVGMSTITGTSTYVVASVLFCFLLYVMTGGAERIIRVSDKIIPIKVGFFFVATIIVLAWHHDALIGALKTILDYAFTTQAATGAFTGYTVQSAIRFGMSRSLNATEAGLGTSGILFGSTGSLHPFRSATMSLASIFISNYLVCFLLMLLFVATGTWNSGLTGITMTIAAYSTVFGVFGGWLITFLSMTFGLGCLIAYAYIGRECWSYLTNGKYLNLYALLYCLVAFAGAVAKVEIIWNSIDIVNAGLLMVNLYGLFMLIPFMRTTLSKSDN